MALSESPKAKGVHLVGSIPLSSTEEVIRTVCAALPNRLKRIPDGETGERHYFVRWLAGHQMFKQQPILLQPMYNPNAPTSFSDDEANKIAGDVGDIEIGYAKAALESYPVFRKLKQEGVIAKDVRFLIALPTPLSVVTSFVRPALQARVEPVIEAALLRDVQAVQEGIPAEELAIQWDAPFEFGFLEGIEGVLPGHEMQAWFSPVFEGAVERLVRIGEAVDPRVELGFHFCYGDIESTHFIEPTSMGFMADVGETVLSKIKRRVDWIHMPVPKSRTDKQYFEPLKKLAEKAHGHTQLVLGLVHADDLEGTRERIRVAGEFAGAFAVATECGMGRGTPESLQSTLKISAEVSAPIK